MKCHILFISLLLVSTFSPIACGPLAYGLCQTGCNLVTVACYAAGGATFGTVTAGAGVPAVIAGCSAAQGTCMAGCIAVLAAPTF